MGTEPLALSMTLIILVVACDWATRHTALRHAGIALTALGAGALAAHLGLIPVGSEHPPVYRVILITIAPIGIFYLTLEIKLADLQETDIRTMVLFLAGAVGTLVGAAAAYLVFLEAKETVKHADILAGMLAAAHIGGTLNLSAVALEYDMQKTGSLFAVLIAIDHALVAVWIAGSILFCQVIERRRLRSPATNESTAATGAPLLERERHELSLSALAATIAAGLLALYISRELAALLKHRGVGIPAIAIITLIGLIIAQSPARRLLGGSRILGALSIYLFLLVIGASAEFGTIIELGKEGVAVTMAVGAVFAVHGIFLALTARLLKLNPATAVVVSQACIGGPVSAAALATAIGRNRLVTPAIILGSLGSALGTFAGFTMVRIL